MVFICSVSFSTLLLFSILYSAVFVLLFFFVFFWFVFIGWFSIILFRVVIIRDIFVFRSLFRIFIKVKMLLILIGYKENNSIFSEILNICRGYFLCIEKFLLYICEDYILWINFYKYRLNIY